MGKKREKEKKGRASCCEKDGVKKGAWTEDEDKILVDFITENGHGSWRNLPKNAGLLRCGKSCRLRWTNYLRPDIKRGPFSPDEENTIIHLHTTLGNKWAAIATHLPGRTDNDIKNFWNSHLRKRYSPAILNQPSSSSKSVNTKPDSPLTRHMAQWENVRLDAESRLSTKTLLPSCSKNQGDHFLRLWNSKVGESFRSLNEEWGDPPPAHSPVSQTSSLTKAESGSRARNGAGPVKTQPFTGTTPEMTGEKKMEIFNCKIEEKDDGACLDALISYEFDDSSESMLKLLLDFPVGDNDMGFLQGQFDNFTTFIQN